MAMTKTPAARRYADPAAAADILARLGEAEARLTRLDLTVPQLTMLAATLAWSYVSDSPQVAANYYRDLSSTGYDDARDEALEVLAWLAVFGPNGSDAQRAASRALSWSRDHHAH